MVAEQQQVNTNMRWYTLRIVNNKERKVKERIDNDLKRYNLEKYVEQILIPMEKFIRVKDGKKIEKERLTYQGYVFIKADLNGEVMPIFKNIDGVVSFVSDNGRPTPISERDMKLIHVYLDDNTAKHKSAYSEGEDIKIMDGAFKGFQGKVDTFNADTNIVGIIVKIFGRDTKVDLSTNQIERI